MDTPKLSVAEQSVKIIELLKDGGTNGFKKFENEIIRLQNLQKKNEEDDYLLQVLSDKQQNGLNILHVCASQGYTQHVQIILNCLQQQNDRNFQNSVKQFVNMQTNNKETALMLAIRCGHGGFQEIIQILLKTKDVDLNFISGQGVSCIHLASELGQDDTLEALINHKADVNLIGKGLTPLMTGIIHGQFNAVQILYQDGNADVNICNPETGDTLLHYAAIGQGNAALYIKYLVDKCGMSVRVKNKERLTPRMKAQKIDRFKFHRVIKLLRELEEKEKAIESMEQSPPKEFIDILAENKLYSIIIGIFLGIFMFFAQTSSDL